MDTFMNLFCKAEADYLNKFVWLELAKEVNKRETFRRMFVAHYVEGVSTKVIGQCYGYSGPRVRQIINKEMSRLRHPTNAYEEHPLYLKYPQLRKVVMPGRFE